MITYRDEKMKDSQAYYTKMTTTPVSRLIISLGIPTTISMLVTSLYNMVDTYFVGTLGESQQAATGILFTLQAIIQAVAFMLGQGSGTIVSKALAMQDQNEASEYVSTGFYTGAIAGLILTVFGLLFLTPFMRFLGSTETILPYAKQYGFWVLFACPFTVCSFVLNNNLRYEGKAFYAMIGISAGAILNVFGDYVFIRIFDMGVFGAGLSTALSQIISFGILYYYFRKMAQSSIRIRSISRDVKVYLTIMKVGFPAVIRQGLSSISSGLLNNLTKPFGDAAIAAMSVVNRFTAFVMCVGLGIGQGFQPVAAFNYEAKKYKRVKKGLLFTMAAGAVLVGILAAAGFVFAPQIVFAFQESKAVNEIGVFALRCGCVGVMFLPLSVPVNMLFQSIRKAGLSSFLSLLRSGLSFIPVLIIGTKLWGLLGIQIAQPVADALTGFISIPFALWFLKTTPSIDVSEKG